jgi:hypothetical protein
LIELEITSTLCYAFPQLVINSEKELENSLLYSMNAVLIGSSHGQKKLCAVFRKVSLKALINFNANLKPKKI